ncbi:Fis family transcriptional regulator, partial [bacterium]
KEDIPLLIEHLIDKLSKKRGKEVIGIEEKAMEILCSYEWPGNVRELQNVFEYIFVHINSRVIGVNCLPPYLRQRRREVKIGSLSKVEKELIINALRDTGYNKKEVARILGISRTTLWRKMKKYGINI